MRIGMGIDYHQLSDGRKLIIGGVNIPYHKGSLGHSDADVLLHAISDALLGSLSLGDIGKYFPNTDPTIKDIDSKIILTKVLTLIENRGYSIVNVDSMVCLESPKINCYIDDMRLIISSILKINFQDVSIKATTTEKMGFVGKGEGLMAQAVVLIQKNI